MENLNKENFWNELHKQCPEAVDHFCNWIDDFKKANDWDSLFDPELKFHDLPFDMQNGIIARYELELYNNHQGKGKEVYERLAEAYKEKIKNIFIDLQMQFA